jgi:hypothetical protein
MEDSGSKRNGRNVPFSGGAETENEAQGAGWQAGLVGVRHDGGIEQRGGFQRVLGQEKGADQQPPLFGNIAIGRQQVVDLFKAFQKDCADLLVPLGEFGGDSLHQGADLFFGKQHDPVDDPADPLRISRGERPQKNARLVGPEYGGGAFEVD